jgi:hypothetical protein
VTREKQCAIVVFIKNLCGRFAAFLSLEDAHVDFLF